MPNVQAAEPDMNENTLTVTFDDEGTSLEKIVAALHEAGYAVPSYTQQ